MIETTVEFQGIASYKKPEKLLSIQQDWQQLSTFSIDPKSKGFSELIDQLSELCNHVFPERSDDELAEDNAPEKTKEEFQKEQEELEKIQEDIYNEMREIFQVMRNFLTQ